MGRHRHAPPSTARPVIRHLYVHVPFCHRICPYCSFYKHTPDAAGFAPFVDAVLAELEARLLEFDVAPATVYFGGGTPSLLGRRDLERLVGGVLGRAGQHGTVEAVELEANPSTFGLEKARLMRALGITRVSLGVQSWDRDVLATLGRDHSPEEAEQAFHLLREAGIPSVNIDHMFAVPNQSPETWADTLAHTIALGPDHASAYNLTYEEDTAFFERFQRGEFTRDEETDARFFTEASGRFSAAGFVQYEISNFARPGHESLHNWGYWRGHDYLGLGPGAVSTANHQRWKNIPDTSSYTARTLAGQDTRTELESLTADAFFLERVALELRTREGTPLSRLTRPDHPSKIEALLNDGLAATSDSQHLVLTPKGRLLADAAVAYLVG